MTEKGLFEPWVARVYYEGADRVVPSFAVPVGAPGRFYRFGGGNEWATAHFLFALKAGVSGLVFAACAGSVQDGVPARH
jgi:hypothetical protein